MITLLITLMLAQADAVTPKAPLAGGASARPTDGSMGYGGVSGYGRNMTGYNTKTPTQTYTPPTSGMVGSGSGAMADEPLVLTPIYKPRYVPPVVDRDGAQWVYMPALRKYRNSKTGDLRYRAPAGAVPYKAKARN